MKRSEVEKLRAKSAEDLKAMVGEIDDSMLKSRMQRSIEGKQVGVGYRNLRRQVARIHTIITQKAAGEKKA
jgi:ribosomal protein L29